jgi:glucose/mannose-6-phosphate isomerase
VLADCVPGLDYLDSALAEASTALKRGMKRYARELPFDKNFAKRLAYDIQGVWPVIIGSEATFPIAVRFAAQLNENANWPAHASAIPEMNHNEIVAYTQDGPASNRTGIIFLRDKDDHPRVQFRQEFTADIVEKNVAWIHVVKGEGKGFLSRMLTMLQTADYASYYLAVARGLDPLSIHAIDMLKERLGKIA